MMQQPHTSIADFTWSTVYSMIRVLSFQFEGCAGHHKYQLCRHSDDFQHSLELTCWLTFVGKPPNWSLVVHQQCPHTTFHTLCETFVSDVRKESHLRRCFHL